MLDLFVTRGLYGTRPWNTFEAFVMEPGHLRIILGSWTIDLTFSGVLKRAFKALLGILAASLWFTAATAAGVFGPELVGWAISQGA